MRASASTEACARCARAERVVHVEVGQRRHRPTRTPDRSSPPRGGTAGSREARRGSIPAPVRRPPPPPRRCNPRANTTSRPSSDGEMDGHRFQAEFRRDLALRPSQVRSQDDGRAPFERVPDGRKRRPDARVIGNRAVLDRHVEIDADEDPLARQLEVANGQLGHVSLLYPELDCVEHAADAGNPMNRARDSAEPAQRNRAEGSPNPRDYRPLPASNFTRSMQRHE